MDLTFADTSFGYAIDLGPLTPEIEVELFQILMMNLKINLS